ncbi:neurofilament medium polypeptide-like [Salvia splendens]|uniref:neurofilament medium polypeptide-like n=1 Tax=Salvia splendens TaxID=180675 RepID=UPI001C253E5D|nr:neurofilament medium polypeptide-like [Salvia splendens]
MKPQTCEEERKLQLQELEELRLESYDAAMWYKERTKLWHDKNLPVKELQTQPSHREPDGEKASTSLEKHTTHRRKGGETSKKASSSNPPAKKPQVVPPSAPAQDVVPPPPEEDTNDEEGEGRTEEGESRTEEGEDRHEGDEGSPDNRGRRDEEREGSGEEISTEEQTEEGAEANVVAEDTEEHVVEGAYGGEQDGETLVSVEREILLEVEDDEIGGEPTDDGLKDVVDLEELPEYGRTPGDKREIRRSNRRSRQAKRAVAETQDTRAEGDTSDKAKERHYAEERKRKGKAEAKPLVKKHKIASSKVVIEEPVPTTVLVPYSKALDTPDGDSENVEEHEPEQQENSVYEKTEVFVTRKLLDAMAQFDDP